MIFLEEGETIQELILSHMTVIVAIAKRHGRGLPKSIELDDIVQTAIVRLLKDGPKFDSARGTFAAWAHHVAKAGIIDAYRRRNYKYELHEDLHENIVDSAPSLDERLERKRRCEHVRHALKSLPPAEKKAVEDHVMDDRTYSETGRAQNRSASWAFYQTRCGLHRVKRSLAMHKLDE